MNKRLHILMIEDSSADADLNAERLAEAGISFDHRRVDNERDYVRELEEFNPDVILADYRLPKFDGITALRLARERRPFVPFIIVSGILEEEAAVELFKAGAADYIRKGRPARLGTAVKNALALRAAQEEKAHAEKELLRSYRELERRVDRRTRELARARETAEQRAREAEEGRRMLEVLMDNIPAGIIIVRKDLSVRLVSRYGLEMSVPDPKGKPPPWWELYHPDGVTAAKEEELPHARAIAGGETIHNEEWVVRKADGTKVPVLVDAAPIRDAGDSSLGSVTVWRDVVPLKKAEDELRRSKEFTDTILSSSLNGLYIYDWKKRVLTFINSQYTRLTGYTLEEVNQEGETFFRNLFHPDDVARVLAHVGAMGSLKDNEVREIEYRFKRKDGQWRWFLSRENAVSRDVDGTLWQYAGSFIDITDRRHDEDTLRRNEYELRTLVDNSPDLIFRMNRQLQYVYANPAFERVTGIPREKFIGKMNEDLGMPQQLVGFWGSAVRGVIDSGREHSVEFDMAGLFGKRYFFARLIPEFAKTGLVETVLVIARDITERTKAEERIRYISFHDEVTGLFNRAFFEEEIRRVDTERELPISIIMGDVNNLKLSNDVFGHDEGDRLLKAIADIFRKAYRKNDIIARWGGDEFAVILPGTDRQTVDEVRGRIQQIAEESKGTVIRPSIALGAATKEKQEQNIYQIIRHAEERMYHNKLVESKENEECVYASLFEKARERNRDLAAHLERSDALADRFGTALSLSENQRDDLRLLTRLHDIGDAVIPPELLAKPGPLNAQEWETMKRHVEAGMRIVRSFADTARISDEVFSHGERWDGSGYPRGLKGKDIPYLVRVFQVIDAFDVMTHPRPYAPALTQEEAAEELRRNAGKQFDPGLTDVFIDTALMKEEIRGKTR